MSTERIEPIVGFVGTLLGLWISAGLAIADHQEPPAQPQTEAVPRKRPGRFRLGPLYLTPRLHIGTIGLDNNVFYTPTDAQADLTASGGPGLELVLPIRESTRLSLEGVLDYLYFLRTESLRQLNGTARASFEWNGPRTRVRVNEIVGRTYRRPSFEVDRRVRVTSEGTEGEIKQRLLGRLSIVLGGGRARHETGADEVFLGTNLQASLTRDEYRIRGGLDYALTIKTSVVAEAERLVSRFPFDPRRDSTALRVVGGLRTDAAALIAGHALAGVRVFRLERGRAEQRLGVVDIDATLNATPKTRIGASYTRDLNYSAFTPAGGTPTLRTETYGARIEKDLIARLDVKLFGRVTRFVTDGPITAEIPGGDPVVAVRDDTAREGGADLGYRFRERLRIGVAAVYTERRSSIAYFGIRGLIVGATVRYDP